MLKRNIKKFKRNKEEIKIKEVICSQSRPIFRLVKIATTIGKKWKTIKIPSMHGQATLVVSKSIIFLCKIE